MAVASIQVRHPPCASQRGRDALPTLIYKEITMTFVCHYCKRIIGTTDKDEATQLIESVCNQCIDDKPNGLATYQQLMKEQG